MGEYRKIKRNAAKCLKCGDIIESKTVHDYVTCSCGRLSVDGGTQYLKRVFEPDVNGDEYEELSEFYEEEIRNTWRNDERMDD